eukprot:g26595.t1
MKDSVLFFLVFLLGCDIHVQQGLLPAGYHARWHIAMQIDPLARFRKQPTVVPDAASRADPPPAVPPVLVNNVARFKRATAADNVNIPTIASDPLARFKRQRKSESSSISSSPSAPATSSSSSSSYSIVGLNYLPSNAPNFFNTILPTLHNETLTPGGPVSSGEITAAEKAALPLHIRYNAPIKRRFADRKTARTYTYTKRKRGIPRDVRPGARERLLGMTLAHLDHSIHSVCCAGGYCYMCVSTELCVQARINNICKSLKELRAWLCSQLEAFDSSQGRHYRIRGRKVCRKMWMKFFGVGERTMRRALKLYNNNKTFYVHAGPLAGRIVQDDWIYSIMFDYFEKNGQVIADGMWHLQKVDDFEPMYKYICEQWVVDIPFVGRAPAPPPCREAVKMVRKRDWSHVKEMRVGEFGICNTCFELQRVRDEGFTGERDAQDWQVANNLHHRIHQICRKQHQNRIAQAAVVYKWLSCFTIDMSRPFYIPSARRVLDDFKGKHVMELMWGGADLFDPKTMASSELDLEVDGAGDNTAKCAQMFYCHICKVQWKDTVRTNRCPRHHTHNIQDQRHYITRYFGWNKTMITTNIAQGLYKMMLGYRNSGSRVVLLLLTKNYDWEDYFSPCESPNMKYTSKPLSWKYQASAEEGGMPTAEYKQHGGVPGAPQLKAYLRPPVKLRPTELPPENWVTEKKRADLHEIFNCKPGYMSEEEIEWMKEVMSLFTITRIHRDGVYGQDGLPGYPAHLGPCVDRKGHAWLANNIRVLDELPEGDLWAVPPARFAAREARDSLTAEEKKMLPHHEIFSRKPTPQHPKTYPGARVMTEDEKETRHSIGVERDPVEEIAVALSKARQEGLSEEKFCKVPGVTVPKLKAYCKAKGLATKGNKPALLSRV